MKTVLSFLLILWLSFSLSVTGFAQDPSHLYPISLEQRIQQATLIAEGEVISSQGFWDETGQHIYTSHLVKVSRYFKGSLSGKEIEIITPGGTVDLQIEVHSSGLTLSAGQKGLFFAIPHAIKGRGRRMPNSSSFSVYSGPQGFLRYDDKEDKVTDPFTTYPGIEATIRSVRLRTSKEIKLVQDTVSLPKTLRDNSPLAVPTISGFSPTTISAGTSSILTITGTNFNAVRGSGYVEFRNANNGGSGWMQPLASDYISWTDTEIQVKVPSTNASGVPAGTGQIRVTNSDPSTATSVGSLTVNYAYINIAYALDGVNQVAYAPDHVNANGAGGYTFQYNTTFAANTMAAAAFDRAMDSWTCATGMNWMVGSNTAVATNGSDGTNVVTFSSTMGAGTLGTAISYYSGCLSGSNLVWYVREIDVLFNSTYTWNYSTANATAGQFDFESVAVHELGHAHQLTHVIYPTRIMHYGISIGSTSRNLSSDDIAGGFQVRNNSIVANVCGNTSPMTVTACSFVLPVKLDVFTGTTQGQHNHLAWATSQEEDVKAFEVQVSYRGADFATLQTVSAKGTAGSNNYQAIDFYPAAGEHNYRLKMVNSNGSFTYSPIVNLTIKSPGRVKVSNNPFQSNIVLTLPDRAGNATIRLLDASGKMVTQRTILPTAPNVVNLTVDPSIPNGLYFLETILNGERFVQKLIKHQ